MADKKSQDLFMNFKDIEVKLDASDATTVVEEEIDTGLSIRGALVWIVHSFQILFPVTALTATTGMKCALCTRKGLAAIPSLQDNGVVGYFEQWRIIASAVGFETVRNPQMQHFLPPIPLAAPKLSLYGVATANDANLRGTTIGLRIGFTTAPMDNAMYTEIAETWGW